jgi:hypothetical protein
MLTGKGLPDILGRPYDSGELSGVAAAVGVGLLDPRRKARWTSL